MPAEGPRRGPCVALSRTQAVGAQAAHPLGSRHRREHPGHFVTRLLQRFRNPEHSYRNRLGLLSLSKRYGPKRVEAACTLALELGAGHYRHVRDILSNGRDLCGGHWSPAWSDRWGAGRIVGHRRGRVSARSSPRTPWDWRDPTDESSPSARQPRRPTARTASSVRLRACSLSMMRLT